MKKGFLLILILATLLVSSVYALTGSIGNARAIVNVEIKDEPITLERTVLVNNVNDEPVKIDLEAGGDIIDLTEIVDKEFTLQPDESKDARFKVTLRQPGTYQGKIYVRFSPLEKGTGVGLTSALIISVTGPGEEFVPSGENVIDEEPKVEETDEETGVNISPGKTEEKAKFNFGDYGLFITIAIALGLVVIAAVFIVLIRRSN